MSTLLDISQAREKVQPREGEKPDQLWCRRQALQLVAQLPDDKQMALAVLYWAERLVCYINDGPNVAA